MGKRSCAIGVVAVLAGCSRWRPLLVASQYVDLGDSYASGVGTRVFYGESGSCKRSRSVWAKIAARRATAQLSGVQRRKTSDVIAKQLGTLGSTALVSISIGGNDAGFSNVIINCALYYFTCGGAINEANSYIALLGCSKRHTTTQGKATAAHVVVVGYPPCSLTRERLATSTSYGVHEKKLNETGDKLDAASKPCRSAWLTFVDPRAACKR